MVVWHEKFGWLAPHYVLLSLTAFAMSAAYVEYGVAGAAVFTLPLFALWLVVRQYTRRTSDDVRRLQSQSRELERSEERFRLLVEKAPGLIAVVRPDATLRGLYANGARGLRSMRVDDLVHPADLPRLRAALTEVSGHAGSSTSLQLRFRGGGHGWREYVTVLTDLTSSEAVGGVVLNGHDVTEQKDLERRLRHQAFHDPLTGLPNRVLFGARLEHALAWSNDHGRRAAVMFIDLDRFKSVNDTLGHQAGDELLAAVPARIRSILRAGDTLARFGGDEFTVLIEEAEESDEVLTLARRIVERREQELILRNVGGRRVQCYLYARPQPAEAIEASLVRWRLSA